MEKIAVISKDQKLVPFLHCNLVEIYEKEGHSGRRFGLLPFLL